MDCLTSRWVPRHLGLIVAVVVFTPLAAAAQAVLGVQPPPGMQGQAPRDRVLPPRVGTASVKGRVVDGVTGNAVARARVRLTGQSGSKGQVFTDGAGAFEFAALPAGSYRLQAEKSTYLTAQFPDLGRLMRARMEQLVVQNGQAVENVSIPLFHGCAVAGRIVDAYGDPIESAQVRLLRVSRSDRPTPAGQGQTNDLGEFRVSRLQPGRYLVQVRPQVTQNYYQDASVVETPLPQPVPTYYPSVLSLAQAQAITLNRGETVSGIDMMLVEGMPTIVTGTVLRSDGEPVLNGSINTRIVSAETATGADIVGGTGIRQGGAFRLTLTPGEYSLEAQVMIRQGIGPTRPEDQLVGTARITVTGGTIEPLTIMVGRGATASGKVVFEGTTPPPPSPGQAHIPLFNPDGPGCRSAEATIAADWTFKVDSLIGTCGAPPQAVFGRWALKSVTFRGESLMDRLVTFEQGQQYSNIQVVVSDKRTTMDLRVSGDDGQPTREYVAMAFPMDKAKWTQRFRLVRTFVPPQISMNPTGPTLPAPPGAVVGAALSDSIRMSGGMGQGMERMIGLPAGEYYVIAVDDIEAEDSQDPAVLERLAASAIRVVLTDEGPLEVPLRRFNLADLLR